MRHTATNLLPSPGLWPREGPRQGDVNIEFVHPYLHHQPVMMGDSPKSRFFIQVFEPRIIERSVTGVIEHVAIFPEKFLRATQRAENRVLIFLFKQGELYSLQLLTQPTPVISLSKNLRECHSDQQICKSKKAGNNLRHMAVGKPHRSESILTRPIFWRLWLGVA